MTKKEIFKGCVEDCIVDLLFYDRKECEDLTQEDIAELEKEVTPGEIIGWFSDELFKQWEYQYE